MAAERASPLGARRAASSAARRTSIVAARRASPGRAAGATGRAVRALLLASPVLLAACSDAPRRPNLLLVSVDTLRADRLGCYGAGRDTSPHLDALAARGVVFDDVMSPSSWTLPSHASLLTGRLPSAHGLVDDGVRLGRDVPTLAGELSRLGYRTLAVVSHVYVSRTFGLERGFDLFDDTLLAGGTRNPIAGEVVDRALELLPPGDDDRPWFLFVHLFDPHWDYTPPPPWDARFTDPDYDGAQDGRYDAILAQEQQGLPFPDADREQLLALYDGEIAYLDEQLGRLLGTLDERGAADDLVVVVTADHGEEFEEHGALGHGKTLFGEQLRVPLIVSGSDAWGPGTRRGDPVSPIDVAPTLLALAGGDGSALAGDGRSLLAPPDPDRLRIAESIRFGLPMRAARLGRHKLVHDMGRGERLLFDLVDDPGEQRPLATDPTDGALAAALDAYASRADAGWHLKVLGLTTDVTRTRARIETPGRIVRARHWFSENIRGAGAQFLEFETSPDGHVLSFDLGVLAHMGEVVFETEPADAPVTFELRVDSSDPRAGVFLGTDLRVADGTPIELHPDDPRLAGLVDHRDAASGCYIRAVPRTSGDDVELPDAVREALRQLGYTGDEDGG